MPINSLRHRRIVGLDVENSVTIRLNGKALPNFNAGRLLPGFVPGAFWKPGIERAAQFTRAPGARIYIDHGFLEYATPECGSPAQAIVYKLALERLLVQCADRYVAAHSQNGDRWTVDILTNNITPDILDDYSFGYHINLEYIRGGRDIYQFAEPLIAYLITSIILFGTGRMRIKPSGQRLYGLSQRAQFFHSKYSNDTVVRRAIVNTRDEPHSKVGCRYHHILADNPIRPQLGELNISLLEILITMCEEQKLVGLGIHEPVKQLHAIDDLLSAKIPHQLRIGVDGKGFLTPLEIQSFYMEQVWDFLQANPDQARHRAAWQEWKYLHDQVGESGYDAEQLQANLDWATKKVILDKVIRKDPRIRPQKLKSYEATCHQITGQSPPDQPSATLYQHLFRKYARYDEAAVQFAGTEPPRSTRAWPRWQLLNSVQPGERILSPDWGTVTISNDITERRYELPNPQDPTIPEASISPARAYTEAQSDSNDPDHDGLEVAG